MLKIRLTAQDAETLATWAREAANARSYPEAVRLLLAVVLDIEGDPPNRKKMPKPHRHRPPGSTRYATSVGISQLTDSASSRALWVWGAERGCRNVAESFRLVLAKIREAYPELGETPPERKIECLHRLATLIEEKSHLARSVRRR